MTEGKLYQELLTLAGSFEEHGTLKELQQKILDEAEKEWEQIEQKVLDEHPYAHDSSDYYAELEKPFRDEWFRKWFG